MGKKVNPLALRPNFKKCQWFTSNKKKFAMYIFEDYKIRKIATEVLSNLFVDIFIERTSNITNIIVHTHKKNTLVYSNDDKKMSLIEEFKTKINKEMKKNNENFVISISEVLKPELNAKVIAMNLSDQIKNRVATPKNLINRAALNFFKIHPQGGIKIEYKGRINGASIANKIKVQYGTVPLSSISFEIDFALVVVKTSSGTSSIRINLYKWEDLNEVLKEKNQKKQINTKIFNKEENKNDILNKEENKKEMKNEN